MKIVSKRWTSALAAIATITLSTGILIGLADQPAIAAQTVPSNCSGSQAPNASVEDTGGIRRGAPAGYTFQPGDPSARLYTDGTYPSHGPTYALISTPTGRVSTAYLTVPFVAGGVYDLTVWAGTHDLSQDQPLGLQFLDSAGNIVADEEVQADHDVDIDRRLGRFDLPSITAPANAASVRFFASTNASWIKWDCVYLQIAAYEVIKEVFDPVSGLWLDADGDPASPGSNNPQPAALAEGDNAQYRITVNNTGSKPLSNITVTDPWCDTAPTSPISLAAGASQQLTCDHAGVALTDDGHVNTASVSGVTYQGCLNEPCTLPDKSETATITVAPGINRLGDKVWYDVNRDGIQDTGEVGVEGVVVTLQDSGGTTVGTTNTDTGGNYIFEALEDGQYSVCFDISGLTGPYAGATFTTKDAGGDDALDSDADPGTSCTEPVTLGPGARENLTLDAGIVTPLNRLGDLVWFDANRDGLQSGGAEVGVPGVTVTVLDGSGNPVTGVTDQTTDANGGYLFADLPDGSYQVCFDLAPLAGTVYEGALLTTKDAGDDGLDSDADPATRCTPVVTLGPDKREDLTLDAGITTPLNSLGDVVWFDANRDGLQSGGAEVGVPGVVVTLQDAAGNPVPGVLPVTTDASGNYVFENLPDGQYKVCFDLSGLAGGTYDGATLTTKDTGDDALDSDADPATSCTEPVTLGPGARENLTLDAGIVTPLNRLGDKVWYDANRDGIQDATEVGVPGVVATLQDASGNPVAGVAPVTTDASGNYIFVDLPDGQYKVCFDLSDLAGGPYDGATFTTADAGDDATDSDAAVSDGCTPVVTLGPGARENLTLDAGIVTPLNSLGDFVWFDANRDGIQDATEVGVPGVEATLQDASGATVATTPTDASGNYIFEDLPDGQYKVCFGLSGLAGGPYDGATFTMADAGDDATDSDAAVSDGCTPVVTLGPGARENLTLDAGIVTPLNRLGDKVWYDANRDGIQDATEVGVPDVPVTLQDASGNPVAGVAPVTTDASGNYIFEELPDGEYQVCFDITGLTGDYLGATYTAKDTGDDATDSDADATTGCTEPVTLGPGARENLTLDAGVVTPLNRLGDTLWFDENRNGIQDGGSEIGVPNATVTLKDAADAVVATTTTDGSGNYIFEELPDGQYKVCFDLSTAGDPYQYYVFTAKDAGDDAADSDADPATGCTEPVTLGPGARENLTVDAGVMPRLYQVGDYVWYDQNSNGIQDPGEPPVAGVTLELRGEDGTVIATQTTDPNGGYLFTNVPFGTYQVCVQTGTLPAGSAMTQPGAAPGTGTDSAFDKASACTPPVALGPDNPEDLTLDLGIVPPPPGPLPTTGAKVLRAAGLGGLFLVMGAALLIWTRRRDRGLMPGIG